MPAFLNSRIWEHVTPFPMHRNVTTPLTSCQASTETHVTVWHRFCALKSLNKALGRSAGSLPELGHILPELRASPGNRARTAPGHAGPGTTSPN